ncbi:MAG: PspC domain-containing protein [Alistipes sp.]|nr:PspC domain-containing protein [Alistipes sp.]
MKETVKASLAGIGFVLDRDAFDALETYLETLSRAYADNPDRDEIITDIEARMVEIILSHQSPDTVVDIATVNEVTGQLGTPEETAAAAPGEPRPESAEAFPRRLYRDLDGRKLGGVCNGLARYFDVDPALVRISTAIPLALLIILPASGFYALSGFLGSLIGVMFILYLLMWMAVPAARTPRQRLEMQGRRITATEIEKEMNYTAARDSNRPPQSILARFVGVMGSVFLFGVKFFLIVFGASLGIAAFVLIITMIGLAFGAPWTVTHWFAGSEAALYLGQSTMPVAVFSILVLALIAIPIIMLVYQMLRVSLSRPNNPTMMWILSGCWILLAVFTTVTVLENGDIFRNWHGVTIQPRGGNWGPGRPAGTAEGWELYELNAQDYRDSLARAAAQDGGAAQAEPTVPTASGSTVAGPDTTVPDGAGETPVEPASGLPDGSAD